MDSLREQVAKYARPTTTPINYAISGVRGKGDQLDWVVFRTGILATLLSAQHKGKAVGLMITASHNPAEDNGVKLIDPKGEMMDTFWVKLATEFLNVPDDQISEWLSKSDQISSTDDFFDKEVKLVFIGQDTRDSSERLVEAAKCGINSMKGTYVQYGLLTTPQLHFLVNVHNQSPIDQTSYPDEKLYFKQLADAFNDLCQGVSNLSNYKSNLVVDCANGVGAPKFAQLSQLIKDNLQVKLINTGDGKLNHLCGADFVKLEQKPPQSLNIEPNVRYASFDGDADRIVYFCAKPTDNQFVLIDGDKMSVLCAIYLQKLLQQANLQHQLSVCVVQTAYANGSSTNYLVNNLKIQVHCVATGVLNLHEKASESDLGIYFEANGHGTVLFSQKARDAFEQVADEQLKKQLLAFVRLINQTTGDAFSDLLMIEAILRKLDWSEYDWSSIYIDLPQRQLKTKVPNRLLFKVTKDETKCLEPEGLQEEIDTLCEQYGKPSRCFVRPSQTEDIVRVYAESQSQDKADKLAAQVQERVQQIFQK